MRPAKRVRKFRAGDKVQRRVDVFTDKSPIMYGTVVRCYDKTSQALSDGPLFYYPELYVVLWDKRGVSKGYLPHGIDIKT
jgi:hypothetical protein